jgi:RsiW-degrading membrane proteinase PrsW (M82 family)
MKGLVTFLLIVSAINLLWFPVTDGVHEVLHALKSELHVHTHHQNHIHTNSSNHHHSTHHVEEHETVKNILNAFASLDEKNQSITVILFLFFSTALIYFFLLSFTEKIFPVPLNQEYTLYIPPLTPPPLS